MEIWAYLGLGHSYRKKNQIQTAIEYCEKALEIARQQENKGFETRAYLALGDAYLQNNQIQTAIEYYMKKP